MIKSGGNLLQNILNLNLAVLLMSTSGVFGRYIDLPSELIIATRALLAGIILLLFCKWKKFDLKIWKEDRKVILIGGILLGVHWVTYFYALKLSNIGVAMISLFTYPVMTSILEPLILQTKILKFHILLAVIILTGIYFLVPDFNFENNYTKAIGFGLISALSYSLRNIIMKSKIDRYNGSVLMTYQLFIIAISLLPLFFFLNSSGFVAFLPFTFLLALLTTALGHTLFLYSFKHFSTISASIISCLQPVYGILLGILFLQENPEKETIIGGILIITAVLGESFRMYYKTRRQKLS